MLISGGREESSGLWATRALLLLWTGVRERNECQKYTFLKYIEVTFPIDMVR